VYLLKMTWENFDYINICHQNTFIFLSVFSIADVLMYCNAFWFVEFVQDELPCIADFKASFARHTDVIEKELQECDYLIQQTNLGI